jgi:NTE family protein
MPRLFSTVETVDRGRRHLVLGSAALLASGCAVNGDQDHQGADAPREAGLRGHAKSLRTAWVFSSGGPRGFTHVGVIKALDELGVRPDLLVGASAGAAVAVLYAAGRNGAALEALALDLPLLSLARLNMGGDERFSGAGIANVLRDLVGQPLLERLPVPAVPVVQRLADGAVLGFTQGDLGLAVQASCAIEGQFTPVRIRGQRYADADLKQPMPVRLARALGATKVLAVDASTHEDKAPAGTERWRPWDLRKRALTQPDAQAADVLIHPDFGYYASMSREYRLRCIEAGYTTTMAAAAWIKVMHAA